MIDQSIVAYGSNKWYLVPAPKHSIPNIIGVFVTYAIEVISLGAHISLDEYGGMHS